jgi:hypothetical protein
LFGFALVLIFLSLSNYLMDSYTIYAACVFAGSGVLRSAFGAIYPVFTPYMYARLGLHWASSVPAFLALVCVPVPVLLWHYGPSIRRRCKYTRQASEAMAAIMRQAAAAKGPSVKQQEEARLGLPDSARALKGVRESVDDEAKKTSV